MGAQWAFEQAGSGQCFSADMSSADSKSGNGRISPDTNAGLAARHNSDDDTGGFLS